MIASFALMGDLYQYDPYDTEASLWNSYPWQIGEENLVDFDAAIPEFSTMKTIWELDDGDGIGITGGSLGNFVMFSIIVSFDNLGNLGDGTGNEPEWLMKEFISVSSGSVVSILSESKIIYANANSEREDEPAKLISTLSGEVISVSSELIIIYGNSNSERPDDPVKLISTLSGTVVSIISEAS